MAILLDTHTCAWALGRSVRLSDLAREVIVDASSRAVSSVSVFEIANKVRLGKWPEMAVALSELVPTALADGIDWADVTPEIAHLAGTMDWPPPRSVRPADRGNGAGSWLGAGIGALRLCREPHAGMAPGDRSRARCR